MPSIMPSMVFVNHRTPLTSAATLAVIIAISAWHVAFALAHSSGSSGAGVGAGAALTDGRRTVWVLEAGSPQNQAEESLLEANSMGTWFGPRLGRRRRSTAESDLNGAETSQGNVASPSNAGDFSDDIAFALFRETPWSLRELQQRAWLNNRPDTLDDRRMVNFTPRLGRESGEEILESRGGNSQPPPSPPSAPIQLAAALRSPPFAPRLGRGLLFSPRMGRSSAPAASPR